MSVVRRFTPGRSITMALHAQSFDRVQQAPSFNRYFGQVTNITFHQDADFPAQYGNFGALPGHLLTPRSCGSPLLIADGKLPSAGLSLKIRRDLAPRAQQAAMRGLRLSLSWSVTDKVS